MVSGIREAPPLPPPQDKFTERLYDKKLALLPELELTLLSFSEILLWCSWPQYTLFCLRWFDGCRLCSLKCYFVDVHFVKVVAYNRKTRRYVTRGKQKSSWIMKRAKVFTCEKVVPPARVTVACRGETTHPQIVSPPRDQFVILMSTIRWTCQWNRWEVNSSRVTRGKGCLGYPRLFKWRLTQKQDYTGVRNVRILQLTLHGFPFWHVCTKTSDSQFRGSWQIGKAIQVILHDILFLILNIWNCTVIFFLVVFLPSGMQRKNISSWLCCWHFYWSYSSQLGMSW